ncbi:MAG TPA: hypothetical protein DD706_22970 [Nitrospiraceae bacterium]|nr:hypothetical protein [Nitrospiraceae bacterium]
MRDRTIRTLTPFLNIVIKQASRQKINLQTHPTKSHNKSTSLFLLNCATSLTCQDAWPRIRIHLDMLIIEKPFHKHWPTHDFFLFIQKHL